MMSELITQLAELIIRDNMILFVGTGLRRGLGKHSMVQHLASALAERIDYQRSDRTLSAVARDFEVLHGRRALIQVLMEELQKLDQEPSPIEQLVVASMQTHTKVVTTRFDHVLERTLEQFQKPYVVIVKDQDVSLLDNSKITLIKMQGDINQPNSLVITEDDSDAFISKLPTLSDVIRAFFATKTLVFLGYDLSSDLFKRFFRQVKRNLSVFSRPAIAIVPEPLDEVEIRYWESQNVKICPHEPIAFLEALSQAVKKAKTHTESSPRHSLLFRQMSVKEPEATLPPHPYKGLQSFTAEDRLIFEGREEESHRLTNRILAHRATVLYGESGSGKSSLLAAGVSPLLAQRGALLAVVEPLTKKPLEALIREQLTQVAQTAGLEAGAHSQLAIMIRAWQRHEAVNGPIVIAIDHFESFFLRYSPQEREVAIKFLRGLLDDRSLDLRLLLVVREDFLGALQALQSQLPKLLQAPFRLQWLSHEAARAAIEEPAKPFKVRWEPALVQRLLDDFYEGSNSGIAPPQLQMVCDFLYRNVVEKHYQAPRTSSWSVNLAEFEALGGTEAILGNYLDQAVLRLPAPQQPTARALLSALVSSTGTKQRLPLTYLARMAEVEPASAKALLEKLSEQLLVRRYEREELAQPTEYELTHQFLALHIARWLDETFWAVQGAREIVREALPDWQGEQNLPPPSKLRLVAAQRHRLPLAPEEAAMLYAAAVSYNHSPEQWEPLLPVPARRAVLLDLLHHREASSRLQAPSHLIAVATPEICLALVETSLTDSEPTVRQAAIESLIESSRTEAESSRAAVARLVDAHKQPASSSIADMWLVRLRDQQPLVHQMLPEELRSPLQREVWRVRWRREQHKILTTTLKGMQGGFWGLGLGMGLLLVLVDIAFFERNLLEMQIIVQLTINGLALAGLLGALTAGSAAFVQVLLQTLPDNDKPRRTWLLSTLVGTILMGLGFLLLVYVFSSSPDTKVAIAGLLIGFALTSVATAPSVKERQPAATGGNERSRLFHLALAAFAGIIAFVLVEQLGLILQTGVFATPNLFINIGEREFEFSRSQLQSVMLIVIGLSSGIGFFLGLNRPSP